MKIFNKTFLLSTVISFIFFNSISKASAAICNWKSLKATIGYWDSCNSTINKYSLNAYISFSSKSCLKYQWTVNGNKAGNSYIMNYPITSNGNYTVCVKVTDTCNSCDTTYCTTRSISCIKNNCNWKSRNPYFSVADSCDKKKNIVTLLGYTYFNFKNSSCFKYLWSVNGSLESFGKIFNYYFKKNGSYVVCMKVIDTCNNCDTTFCITKNISCLSSCNWESLKATTGYWDSCNSTINKYSLNAYISFSSKFCLKYQWTVNGNKAGNSYIMNYPITSNGNYTICVKVTDTCNSCDTSYCTTRNITCVKDNACNWKSMNPYLSVVDTCFKKNNYVKLMGYTYFDFKNSSCFKYLWSVNGSLESFGKIFNYYFKKNGSYVVCMKVIDTCNNCDTTFCITKNISCLSSCNWESLKATTGYWDSCNSTINKYSLNAYISFSSKSCLKYQWTVNGNKAGNSYIMNYPITSNGNYTICVKVTDTCNNCDTSFCTYRVFNCVSTNCNWKSKNAYLITKDTCISSLKNYSISGVIYLPDSSSCYTYQWTVNGKNAGTSQYSNYAITQNGTYNFCVKVNDTCNKCDTTFCNTIKVSCVPAGIGKLNKNENLKIYPNPTNGFLNIEFFEANSDYLIINSNGQIINIGKLKSGKNSIDLSKNSSGFYLIKIKTKNMFLDYKISIIK